MKMKKEDREKIQRRELEPVYTIGVAAMKLGISVHSFRQYENEGLILPFKTPTGRRLYSDVDLEKVLCIKMMVQKEGLNFAGIRRIMAMIPCWNLRNCPKGSMAKCLAFKDKRGPCWASEKKYAHPLPSCRDCPVYQEIVHCDDILPLIHDVGK